MGLAGTAEDAGSGRRFTIAVGAGFALVLAMLVVRNVRFLPGPLADANFGQGLLAAIAVGLVLGIRFRGYGPALALGGLLALVAAGSVENQLVAGPGYEWQAFDQLLGNIGTGVLLGACALTYLLVARRRPARPRLGVLDIALGIAGLVLATGALVTIVALGIAPAERSFDLHDPAWTRVGESPVSDLRTQGLAAAYLPAGASPGSEAEQPVVLVGTLRAFEAYSCLEVFDPWPGSPLLSGDLVDHRDVVLPSGPATTEHRVLEADARDAYLFTIERERLVGFVREDVCYLVAVVGPPGVTLDPSLPNAVAQAFRLR